MSNPHRSAARAVVGEVRLIRKVGVPASMRRRVMFLTPRSASSAIKVTVDGQGHVTFTVANAADFAAEAKFDGLVTHQKFCTANPAICTAGADQVDPEVAEPVGAGAGEPADQGAGAPGRT